MLRTLRSRRRPRYGVQICALISALLLLLSVSLLHTRLSTTTSPQNDIVSERILSDSTTTDTTAKEDEDKIDELDIVEEEDSSDRKLTDDNDDDDEVAVDSSLSSTRSYFFDHVSGAIRRSYNKKSIDEWDDETLGLGLRLGFGAGEDKSKAAFGSDDIPVEESLRRKLSGVKSVEDVLLLKKGPGSLREGWGDWFDKKSDFLRKDKMFRLSFEVLNPANNPMLQDPDGVGVTGLTRGDKLVQKGILNEFKRVPFLTRKVSGDEERKNRRENGGVDLGDGGMDKRSGTRIIMDNNVSGAAEGRVRNEGMGGTITEESLVNRGDRSSLDNSMHVIETKRKSELDSHVYADGKRWGYFPGLNSELSFSEFMDAFFRKGKCSMKVFMVWNSPPWMFSVRHQRGIESLFKQHPDACVVVFSETIELDFFKDSFLKDGYKIAVAMPNLEELLAETPTSVFASVWFEWRKTKFYPVHFSELIRLAALYKYGGIYLDSDIIVLKSLSSLNNTVGQENQLDWQSLNGAVMAFGKHSLFLMECLREYFATYDDTALRWNGADLLTRVARKFSSKGRQDLKIQPFFRFFPLSNQNITRYFVAPSTDIEKTHQDALFKKIMDNSLTFHFWNSLTSAITPEPESLVSRLINHACIQCSDVL